MQQLRQWRTPATEASSHHRLAKGTADCELGRLTLGALGIVLQRVAKCIAGHDVTKSLRAGTETLGASKCCQC
jgi:hypothetical protein